MQSEASDDKNEKKKMAAIHDRMLAFTFTQGKFWVYNGKELLEDLKWENLKNRAWVVMNKINTNKQNLIIKKNKYKLHDGDVVRFGKVLFKINIIQKGKKNNKPLDCETKYNIIDKHSQPVRPLAHFESSKTVFEIANNTLKNKLTIKVADKLNSPQPLSIEEGSIHSEENEDNKEEKTCRICYCGEEDELENPLIEPCKCSGSVRYIHLACSKAWINEQLTQDISSEVKSYCWDRISCELCHSNFKEIVLKNSKPLKLFEKEKIDEDTQMILESIYPDDIKIYFGLIVKKHDE